MKDYKYYGLDLKWTKSVGTRNSIVTDHKNIVHRENCEFANRSRKKMLVAAKRFSISVPLDGVVIYDDIFLQ